MKNFKAIVHILNELNYVLDKGQKQRAVFVFLAIALRTCFELLGVTALVPFLEVMLTPEKLMRKAYVIKLMEAFNIESSNGLLLLMGVGIILIYIVKNLYIILANWIQYDYATKIRKDLSVKMMRSYMSRPYEYFVNINSSEVLRGCNSDTDQVYNILANLILILSEILTSCAIGIFIICSDPIMSFGILTLLVVTLLFVIGIFKPIMKKAGRKSMVASSIKNKAIYEAFEGIKEVFVTQRQKYFIKDYEDAAEMERVLTRKSEVANASPDRIIEGICISGMMGIVCIRLMMGVDMLNFIPVLGAFAVSAFKLLPSASKISSRMNNIVYGRPMLSNVYQIMKAAEEYEKERMQYVIETRTEQEIETLRFNNALEIKHVAWQYENQSCFVLTDVCLEIKKGDSIGLIGTSGAGKTTLGDIILGLLKPQQGFILMDGVDVYSIPQTWSHIVGYIPQAVFVMDDTIRNNIKFGLESGKNEDDLVWEALERAQLKEFVESLPNGLDTEVGERGVKFSGGQRQRIAIARALYAKPEILVMDEATAALDNETERAVMESIDALQGQITMIIVAHRLTTIRNCDKIYEIKEGQAFERSKIEIFGDN